MSARGPGWIPAGDSVTMTRTVALAAVCVATIGVPIFLIVRLWLDTRRARRYYRDRWNDLDERVGGKLGSYDEARKKAGL